MPSKRKPRPLKVAETTRTAPKLPERGLVVHRVKARYDAAQTTDDNRKHWANADALGPNAALAADIRAKLRNRARYEVANNSYAKGIGVTLANDTISDGPSLQSMLTGRKQANRDIEARFWEWVQATNLVQKLRQMRFARYDSGECFAWFVNNPKLRSEVQLDVRLVEPEQIASPWVPLPVPKGYMERDGIIYDEYGNPIAYRRLRAHPGETWERFWESRLGIGEADQIDAANMFHYFRPDRPEQCRGIPDITPALMLFAELRRFTQATIAAAETAAEWAAVVYSDAPPELMPTSGETPEQPSAGDLVELAMRAGVVLPQGWKLGQVTPEHPATTYDGFVNAKLREVARCLCVPAHVASLDPAQANMSSTYVIGQMYVAERIVDRSEFNRFLDEALVNWLAEGRKIPGYLPSFDDITLPHAWFWPSLGQHADPQKVANAQETRLGNGTSNLAIECSREGLDWEEVQEKTAETLGMTVQEYRKRLADKHLGPKPVPKPAPQAGGAPDENA